MRHPDQHAPRPRLGDDQPDTIRAANADRDAAAERLREHHAAGRLTDDEFQQALEQSMAARTLGDLRALLADLPNENLPPAAPYGPGRGWDRGWGGGWRRGPLGLGLLPAVLLLTFLWSALAHHGGWHHGYGGYGGGYYGGPHFHHGPWFPWPLLLLAVAGFAAWRRRMRFMRYTRMASGPTHWA